MSRVSDSLITRLIDDAERGFNRSGGLSLYLSKEILLDLRDARARIAELEKQVALAASGGRRTALEEAAKLADREAAKAQEQIDWINADAQRFYYTGGSKANEDWQYTLDTAQDIAKRIRAEIAKLPAAPDERAKALQDVERELRAALSPFLLGGLTSESMLWEGKPDSTSATIKISLGDIRRARTAARLSQGDAEDNHHGG